MNNASFDDEFMPPEETHRAPVMPLALVPGVFGGGALELCEHSFELQSLRLANAELLTRIDNLQMERDDALRRLEVAEERD